MDLRSVGRSMQQVGTSFLWAVEVKVTFLGSLETREIRNAMRRILEKVRPQSFNCLEVTGIVAKRFLGMRYVTVSAHSRHIQQSCYLDEASIRGLPSEMPNGLKVQHP
jgi:hypothetical protein